MTFNRKHGENNRDKGRAIAVSVEKIKHWECDEHKF